MPGRGREAPKPVGIVLCGGRSRRMGRDKAALPFGEESLLARVIRILADEVGGVWLVAREGQELPELPALPAVAGVARDPEEGFGPLAGIVAGLQASEAEQAFVASCDTPLLQPALVRRLLELARGRAAVVPRVDGHLVPTLAVYSRDLLPAAERLLSQGELRPRLLVREPGVEVVEEAALRDADPELASFSDCDTPDDYDALLARAGLTATGRVS